MLGFYVVFDGVVNLVFVGEGCQYFDVEKIDYWFFVWIVVEYDQIGQFVGFDCVFFVFFEGLICCVEGYCEECFFDGEGVFRVEFLV